MSRLPSQAGRQAQKGFEAMKILLTAINAKYIHSNLAVYSLRAYAGRLSEHVEIAEFTINHYTDYILREIYRRKPDVLAFSCYLWNVEYVRELAAECRKLMPEVPIWVGGPEVSYDSRQFLETNPAVTGIMAGEGEKTFAELTDYYVHGAGVLSEIRGLVYRDEQGQIVENPPQEILDLSTVPFVYEDLSAFENKIIYYETSRGCPFSCSYCLSSIDKRVRFRDLELVKRELQHFIDAKIPQVKFVDRTFNCRHDHTLAIWRYLKEHDNGVTNFHFEVAADLLNEEELALIGTMRPGLIQLEIGVQSVNPDTIHAIDRTMDFERVCQVVRRIQEKKNIHQHLDLIAGLPFEDYDSFRHSFDAVHGLFPEQLQLGFLKVLKGSKMHRNAREYGIVWKEKAPYEVLYSSWISYEELMKLKGVEQMVEIYYNSHQFDWTLKKLLPAFDSAFSFYYALWQFYERKGYEERSHARIRRYEILLEFIRDRGLPAEGYELCMLVDLYAREKLKSRPAFAPDLSAYRETLQAFYKKYGKANHIEVFPPEAEGDGERYVLFDYSRRDPLTGDAYLKLLS